MKIITVLALSALPVFASTAIGSEDPATAPALYDEGSYEGTPWVSGGVGLDERNYMLENLANDYNLKLEIAVADGSYLADAEVVIAKLDGAIVMKQVSTGPWFMTRLPAGSYRVQVSGFGQTFEQAVEVPASGLKTVVFNQWTKAEVAKETPGPTY